MILGSHSNLTWALAASFFCLMTAKFHAVVAEMQTTGTVEFQLMAAQDRQITKCQREMTHFKGLPQSTCLTTYTHHCSVPHAKSFSRKHK